MISGCYIALIYMQQRYYDPVIGRFYSNDPVGRYGVASSNAQRLGQLIKEYFMGDKADQEKAKAQHDKIRDAEKTMLKGVGSMSPVGAVADVAEVVNEEIKGGDAGPEASGAVAGKVAGNITEKILDNFIGKDAANAAGAAVGEVVGNVVESQVNKARGESRETVQSASNECVQSATCSK